ncbi:MAG: hypothetical protein Q6361_02100 [Candidatus Hermodarchaeota archaeon]|jgi:hypothetical protein|nr:hypothetical protein [Candidatus Hermodarchaeota archaeon]
MTKRYKKASDGQWPGYPHLRNQDIETLTIRQNSYATKALVNNRKGRIVLLMDQEQYQTFLRIVQERKGDTSSRSVNGAVAEAVEEWMNRK